MSGDMLMTVRESVIGEFGQVLKRNKLRFCDSYGEPSESSVVFAASALVCAMAPVMTPAPFVVLHERVSYLRPQWDADRHCAVVVDLATPMPAELTSAAFPRFKSEDPVGRYCKPFAFCHLVAGLPMPTETLPEPVYDEQEVAGIETAVRAVHVLENHLNTAFVHLLNAMGRRWDDDVWTSLGEAQE